MLREIVLFADSFPLGEGIPIAIRTEGGLLPAKSQRNLRRGYLLIRMTFGTDVSSLIISHHD
jgi:hypothetical protein